MVRAAACLAFVLTSSLLCGQSDKGPVLYGDGGGRLWKWQGGEKTYLSDEGQNLELAAVDEKTAWGWAQDGASIRFFTLVLPKKKEGSSKKPEPSPLPKLEAQRFDRPDRADRVGNRVLLAYGSTTDRPRWELWGGSVKLASQAYDDGRVIYGIALGPLDGWIIVGRTADGRPWLELSGTTVEAPEGWRGRLTVAAWVAEDEKSPAFPRVAGWAAPAGQAPRAVFWGRDGWTQPAEDNVELGAGVYPVLGAPGAKGVLTLAGWKADAGTGALRPWFWDGEVQEVPGGAADGQPQVFSVGGKGGAFLVVRHQSSPWFTLEDGHESVALEGLGPEDHVRAVAPEAAKAGP